MDGIKRLLGSSKFWTLVATAISTYLVAHNLPKEKADAVVTAITAVGAAVVIAIGYEDGQAKRANGAGGAPPKP